MPAAIGGPLDCQRHGAVGDYMAHAVAAIKTAAARSFDNAYFGLASWVRL